MTAAHDDRLDSRRRLSAGAGGNDGAVFRGNDGAAFTLIEVLVSIAIIAILLGLALPALSAARMSARVSNSLANLRTIGQTFTMYERTYAAFPFGRWGWGNPPETGAKVAVSFYPWKIRTMWPVFMHDIAPWPENAPVWVSPGAEDPNRFSVTWDGPGISTYTPDLVSYHYSTSFIAEGRLWDGDEEADKALIQAQAMADVTYPSAKVLAYDAERAYLDDDWDSDDPHRPVLMADSSASVRLDTDAAEPVPNPLSPERPRIYCDTPMGIDGTDF